MSVLVLGLGNTLLADDGAGVHVVRRLAADPATPACLRPLDGGTLGFRLLDVLARSTDVILVDAGQFDAAAGTLRLIGSDALAGHVTRCGRTSAHEAGLIDLLTLARLDGWTPKRLALLCIQPNRVDWGEELSGPVARALPAACRTVVRTALAWQ